MIKSPKLEIIKEYKELFDEVFSVLQDYNAGNKWRKYYFKDDERIKKIFFDELKLYLNNVKYQIKVLNFLFKYSNYLNYSLIMSTMDMLVEYDAKCFSHIDYMLGILKTACQMQADYKYYVPRKDFEYITDANVGMFYKHAKGMDIEAVKKFLIKREVFSEEQFDDLLTKTTQVTYNGEDTDNFGVFEKAFVIPKVKNGKTALISVHEFVHEAMLLNRDKISVESIINSDDLPIFYEELYKEYNGFIDGDKRVNKNADKLLSTFDDEPFIEQVKKLERLI